jgi:hypothetical protein
MNSHLKTIFLTKKIFKTKSFEKLGIYTIDIYKLYKITIFNATFFF